MDHAKSSNESLYAESRQTKRLMTGVCMTFIGIREIYGRLPTSTLIIVQRP